MHPVDVLLRLGGVATRAQVLGLCRRSELDAAVAAGLVVRDARGRSALPAASTALRAAAAHTGVVSHLSAAIAHGWETKLVPEMPHLTVPRNRNVSRLDRTAFVPHWSRLSETELRDRVTSPERTLADCLRTLPPDEAQCVADSALRHRAVGPEELGLLAATLTGSGSAAARRVAALADGRATNPFESTLRWIATGVRGIDVVPQVVIDQDGFRCRPDLVDVRRRIVLEADSATWHTSRQALRQDCRRYNALLLRDWLVLRFTWEDVMFDAAHVRGVLVAAAAERVRRPPRPREAA